MTSVELCRQYGFKVGDIIGSQPYGTREVRFLITAIGEKVVVVRQVAERWMIHNHPYECVSEWLRPFYPPEEIYELTGSQWTKHQPEEVPNGQE